jgi:SAM-dependent methyltransferase
MTEHKTIDDLIACPRCDRTPLAAADDGHTCPGCKTDFPTIGQLPWLFAEPDAALGEWRHRLQLAVQQLAHESKRIAADLRKNELLASTRKRLEVLQSANDEHRQDLLALLEPIDVQSLQAGYESHLALRTRLPADQGLNTYYNNVHRDWVWGEEENRASMAQLTRVLDESGGRGTGDCLVLGAGAGRLAYDVHQGDGAERTVGVDFNPLLFLIARRMYAGASLDLYEFPLAPASLEDVAVRQTLRAPGPAKDGLHLVLADVLRAPFAKRTFDTVVTPWLIDIVSEDLRIFARRINRLLKPGGRWITFGSLAFDHASRARRYSPDEVLEIAGETGFAEPFVREQRIPYMCSPHSRHGRQELVYTFAAVKARDARAAERHKALPDWIVTGKQPVPLLQTFQTQAMSTRIYAFIMSLIDGRRSIDDMAAILEQQQLMPKAEAVPAIRNFLTRMYDDSQRNPNF